MLEQDALAMTTFHMYSRVLKPETTLNGYRLRKHSVTSQEAPWNAVTSFWDNMGHACYHLKQNRHTKYSLKLFYKCLCHIHKGPQEEEEAS